MGENSYSYDEDFDEGGENGILKNKSPDPSLQDLNEYSGEIFSSPVHESENKTAVDNMSVNNYPDDFLDNQSQNRSIAPLDSKSVISNPPIQNVSADYGDDFSSIGNEPSITSLQSNTAGSKVSQHNEPVDATINNDKESLVEKSTGVQQDFSSPLAIHTEDNNDDEDLYADDFTPLTTAHKSALFSPQPVNNSEVPKIAEEQYEEEYDRLVPSNVKDDENSAYSMNDNVSAISQVSSHASGMNPKPDPEKTHDSSLPEKEITDSANQLPNDTQSIATKASQESKAKSVHYENSIPSISTTTQSQPQQTQQPPIEEAYETTIPTTEDHTLSALTKLEHTKSHLNIVQLQESLNEMMEEMNEDVHEIHRMTSPPIRSAPFPFPTENSSTVTSNPQIIPSNGHDPVHEKEGEAALLAEEEALLYDDFDLLEPHSPHATSIHDHDSSSYQVSHPPAPAVLQKRGSEHELEMHLSTLHQQSQQNLQELYKSSKKLDFVEQSLEQGIVYEEDALAQLDEQLQEEAKTLVMAANVTITTESAATTVADEEPAVPLTTTITTTTTSTAASQSVEKETKMKTIEPEEEEASPVPVITKPQKISLDSLQRYEGSTPSGGGGGGSSKKVTNLRGMVNNTRTTGASPPVSRPASQHNAQRITNDPGGWIGPKSAVKIPPNPIPNHPRDINYLASLPKSLLKPVKTTPGSSKKSQPLRINIPLGFSIHDACIILEDVCPHRKPFPQCQEHFCHEAHVKFQLLTYVRKKAKEAQELVISANDLWKMKLESALEDAIVKLEQEQKLELMKIKKQLSIRSKNDEYLQETEKYIKKTKFQKLDSEEGYAITGGLTQEHCEFVKRQLLLRTEHQKHHIRTVLDHRNYEHLQEMNYFKKSIEAPTIYLENMKDNFLEVIRFHFERLENFILFVIHLAVVPRNLSYGKLNQGEEKNLRIRFEKACKQAEDLYKTSLAAFADICGNIQRVYCHSDEEIPQLLPDSVQQRLRAYASNAAVKRPVSGHTSPPAPSSSRGGGGGGGGREEQKRPMMVKKKRATSRGRKGKHGEEGVPTRIKTKKHQKRQTAAGGEGEEEIPGESEEVDYEFSHELHEFYGQEEDEIIHKQGIQDDDIRRGRKGQYTTESSKLMDDYGVTDFEVIPLDAMEDNPMNGFSRKTTASHPEELLDGQHHQGSSVLEYTEDDFEDEGRSGGGGAGGGGGIKRDHSYYSSIAEDEGGGGEGGGVEEEVVEEEEEGQAFVPQPSTLSEHYSSASIHSAAISLASQASRPATHPVATTSSSPYQPYESHQSYASSFHSLPSSSHAYDSQFEGFEGEEGEGEGYYEGMRPGTRESKSSPSHPSPHPLTIPFYRPNTAPPDVTGLAINTLQPFPVVQQRRKPKTIITKKDLLIANMMKTNPYNHKMLLQEILKQQQRIHERKQKKALLERNPDLYNITAHSASPSRAGSPMARQHPPPTASSSSPPFDVKSAQSIQHSTSSTTIHTKYPCFFCHKMFSGNGKTFPSMVNHSDATTKRKARESIHGQHGMFADFEKKGELKTEEYNLLQQQLMKRLMKASTDFAMNKEKVFCSWECMKRWTLHCCPVQFRYQSDMLINMCAGYHVKI